MGVLKELTDCITELKKERMTAYTRCATGSHEREYNKGFLCAISAIEGLIAQVGEKHGNT